MPRGCCAWYCSNRDTKGCRESPYYLQFYGIPIGNKFLRQKWITAISSGRRDNFIPTKTSVLCSIHFEDSAFVDTVRNTLKPEAVPTLFYIPNYAEEEKMFVSYRTNPDGTLKPSDECTIKPRSSAISGRLPRRLRKIFVDEHTYRDESGYEHKSFSYFVLPLVFCKDVPMVPMFDYSKIAVEPEHPKKAKSSTLAILNKSSDGKAIQEAATPGDATPSVLYLSKTETPPVTTTKPGFVKCVVEGSKSQIVGKSLNPKRFVVVSTDSRGQAVKIRFLNEAEQASLKNSKSDQNTSGATISEEDPLGVKIINVVSLAPKTFLTTSNEPDKDIEEVICITPTTLSTDTTSAETPSTSTLGTTSSLETSTEITSSHIPTLASTSTAETSTSREKVSAVESEPSKNSNKDEAVIELDSNESVEGQSNCDTSKTVEAEKSKNSDVALVQLGASERSDFEIAEKETNQSIEGTSGLVEKTKGAANPRHAFNPMYKKKFDRYCKRLGKATHEQLAYAYEYEDDNIFGALRKRTKTDETVRSSAYKTGKKRRLDRETVFYMYKYGLTECEVMVERLDSQVSKKAASFYKANRENKDEKLRRRMVTPKRTFFYDTPQQLNDPNAIPMTPTAVLFETPEQVRPAASSSKKMSPKKMQQMSRTILPYAEALNAMPKMRQLKEQRQKAELERLAAIVKMEHNYYNQETYIDSQGRLVLNDPRVTQLRERINALKKTIKGQKEKIRRFERTNPKRIEKMKSDLEAAKLERYAPIERTNVHPVVKDLFLCEMKNVSKKNVARYSDTVKEFCSALYKISPKAYSFMNGFFHFPTTKRIRTFELPPFAVSTLVPRPRPLKKKSVADGIASLLPTEPVPLDLEMNDLMYDLDLDESAFNPSFEEVEEDDYEKDILKNPPIFEEDVPVQRPTTSAGSVTTRSTGRRAAETVTSAAAIQTGSPVKKRSTPSRKSKKRKLDEDDLEEQEQQLIHVESPLLQQQQWGRDQKTVHHQYSTQQLQQQQQQHMQQHHVQQHHTSTPQIVYNLYTNPQPGTSAPGASMPDVYLGADSLKSFESYYF